MGSDREMDGHGRILNTAMVSGASRGIGRAIAIRLCRLGYDVFLLGRDGAALKTVVEECTGAHGSAASLAGNLEDPLYREEAVEAARASLGEIDVLVNNAGKSSDGPAYDADLDEWGSVLEVNFNAATHLCRSILPDMIERERGAILNISSILGRNTSAGSAIYAATKHAINGYSGCLFEDVRQFGIKVCSIMPGFVDTAMTSEYALNADRLIRPDDVADSVEYVLSSSSTCCPTEIVIRPQRQP